MKQILVKSLTYFKSALSEANGTGSSKRLYAFLIIVAMVIGFLAVIFIKRLEAHIEFIFSTMAGIFIGLVTASVTKDGITKNSKPQEIPETNNKIYEK